MTTIRKIAICLLLASAAMQASAQVPTLSPNADERGYRLLRQEMVSRHNALPLVGKIAENRPDSLRPLPSLPNHLSREQLAGKAVPMKEAAALADGTQVWGCPINSQSWNFDGKKCYGVYGFDASTQVTPDTLFLSADIFPSGGGTIHDNLLQFFNYSYDYSADIAQTIFCEYDTRTWKPTGRNGKTFQGTTYLANDLTYDPTTGRLYGIMFSASFDAEYLSWVDPQTFVRTDVAQLSNPYQLLGLAANSKGELYGITSCSQLVKINKETGTPTVVGNLEASVGNMLQSIAFDMRTGKLYWSRSAADVSGLYVIDTTTGKASLIGAYPNKEQFVALYVNNLDSVDNAPQKVSDLTVSTIGNSLQANIAFTLPDATVDGTPLSGNISYELSSEKGVLASAQGAAGSRVESTQTLQQGYNTISLTTTAAGASSLPAVRTVWAGADEVAPPTGVSLVKTDGNGNMRLSWNRSVNTRHGKQAQPEEVTYEVRDGLTGSLLTTTADTVYTLNVMQQPWNTHTYTVTPVFGGIRGVSASSNSVNEGAPLSVPYYNGVSNKADFNICDVVDKDDDGNSWIFSKQPSNYAACYKSASGNDDWLLTPPLSMEAGKAYQLRFTAAKLTTSNDDHLEVAMGTGNDPASYETMMPKAYFTSQNDSVLSVTLHPSLSGAYRVGFRYTNDGNGYAVIMKNISISAATDDIYPAAPALQATANSNGDKKADISITMPTTTGNGSTLTAKGTLRLLRNGKEIKQWTNAAPGSTYSYTDAVDAEGTIDYRCMAIVGEKEGRTADTSVWIGRDVPAQPNNFVASVDASGKVSLSWDAVTKGAHGGTVDAANMRYIIMTPDASSATGIKIVQSDIAGTSASLSVSQSGEQTGRFYGIAAYTDTLMSNVATSNLLITGEAYSVPFRETFPMGTALHGWFISTKNGAQNFNFTFKMTSDDFLGATYWYGNKRNDWAKLISGKISLAGTTKPRLSFSYYVYDKSLADDFGFSVGVLANNYASVDTLATYTFRTAPKEGWNRASIPLDKYAGKDISIFIAGNSKTINTSNVALVFDNVCVRDGKDYDIGLLAENTTDHAVAGRKGTVRAHIQNFGSKPAGPFVLKVYDGQQLADSATLQQVLQPGEIILPAIDFPTSLFYGSSHSYSLEASYAQDEYKADNKSSFEAAIVRPQEPVVSDLAVTYSGNGCNLTWSAPEQKTKLLTENFENYTAWSRDNIYPWLTVDGDHNNAAALYTSYISGIGTSYAFQVFKPEDTDLTDEQKSVLTPHSGSQYMAAFKDELYSGDGSSNNDWLISPPLSGAAQKISFYAFTPNVDLGAEQLEVLYSTTNRDTANFIPLKTEGISTVAWIKYSFSLPDGARYFALRYKSKGNTGLFIDDVTYKSGTPVVDSYNIYRDNVLIASTPTPGYLDADADGKGRYKVTVNYVQGESDFSNEASDPTGIKEVSAPAGSESTAIYDLTGKYLGKGTATFRALPHGIYILQQEGKARKVVK